MKFLGLGGRKFEPTPIPQEEIKVTLGSKDDIVLHILTRTLKDHPVLIGNVGSRDYINKQLAKIIDILASVVSNPYPLEPEVIPRELGFSIYTISEPRKVGDILDEVDSILSGELKVLYPNFALKVNPTEEERRRMAIFGRGNQETLNILSANMQSIFKPSQFAYCFSFKEDWEEAEYFLLVELSREELINFGLADENSWQMLARHFKKEELSFTETKPKPPEENIKGERRY